MAQPVAPADLVIILFEMLLMGKKLIPDEIREKVSIIVEKFNQQEFKTTDARYIARFQGRFLYLDRIAYGNKEPVCRMEYFREINKWEFAIFKWSTNIYDPEECMFPGSELVDGTVEGAMRAGMRAYPVYQYNIPLNQTARSSAVFLEAGGAAG